MRSCAYCGEDIQVDEYRYEYKGDYIHEYCANEYAWQDYVEELSHHENPFERKDHGELSWQMFKEEATKDVEGYDQLLDIKKEEGWHDRREDLE